MGKSTGTLGQWDTAMDFSTAVFLMKKAAILYEEAAALFFGD